MQPLRWLLILIAVFTSAGTPGATSAADGLTIRDSRGEQHFDAMPKRVVALNWAMAEHLIDLEVPLLGVANPTGYSEWVGTPALPDGIVDLGKRDAPNLEQLLMLKPDLILLAGEQGPYASRFEQIAPVLHFDLFREDHDNAETARRVFAALGSFFGKAAFAERKLAEMDRRIEAQKEEIATAYNGTPPPVTIVRFTDEKRVVIYGKNGMTQAALNGLGLGTGYPVPNSRWGLAFKPVTALGAIAHGLVLHIEPFNKQDLLFSSDLWRAMPFVKAGNFHAIPSLWTYGGALSIGRAADSITAILLTQAGQ